MKRMTGLLGLLMLMAASAPESWLRRGNAAYERGDFRAALDCYALAAAETPDPGQVAFDAAAAHYELGEFADAEIAYRQSLEDAAGRRRVRALYGLANTLARQGASSHGRGAVAQLTDAVHTYDASLHTASALEPADQVVVQEVLDNASFNRNLVQALLERKLAEVSKENQSANSENIDNRPDEETRREDMRDLTQRGQADGGRQRGNRGPVGDETQVPPGAQSQATDEARPGRGNLPPLSDDLSGAALSPDQALDYLQRNLDRIRRERARRMTPPGNAKGFRDW